MSIRGWPKNITWDEFGEVSTPPGGENGQAYLHSMFSFHYSNPIKDRKGWRLEELVVELSVAKGQSWVVKGKQHPELLSHEQGHYDITGLVGGRELYELLTKLRTGTSKELLEQKDEIYNRINKKVNRLQEKYDLDVKSPDDQTIIAAKQKEWDQLLQSCIQGKKFLPNL